MTSCTRGGSVFLEASTGVEAVAGVERFLDRIAKLREGQALGITPEMGQSALALLALRSSASAGLSPSDIGLTRASRGGVHKL
jgi:hypothetical protein